MIGLSTKQFQNLVKDGVFPQVKRLEGYSLPDIVARFVRYREQGRSADSAAAFKRRELEADARIKESRAGELEGRLVEREEIRQAGNAIMGALAEHLDTEPGRIVDVIVAITGGERARVLEVLERAYRGTRVNLADALDALVRDHRAVAA